MSRVSTLPWLLAFLMMGMGTFPVNAFADDEQSAEEAAAEAPAEPSTSDAPAPEAGAAADNAGNQVKYDPDSAPQENPHRVADETSPASNPAPSDAREDAINARLKALVKRLNAMDQRDVIFPSKAIEAALRTEFIRRMEGGTGAPWLGRHAREADREIALDNFELFLAFAERLAYTATKAKKSKEADKGAAELKLFAAKGVIDSYNKAPKGERAPASAGFSVPDGAGSAGKNELKRRRALLGGLVAGPDYNPIDVKKLDDYGKKYQKVLADAVGEYESLGSQIAKGMNRGPASKAKANKKAAKKKSK